MKVQVPNDEKMPTRQHRLYLMRGFVGKPLLVFQSYFWLSVESETL
jgi:hypothetical protein